MLTDPGHTFAELAELVPGARLLGDPNRRVERLVHPTEVKGASDLVLLLGKPYLEMGAALPGEKPGIVVGEELATEAGDLLGKFPAVLVIERPRLALAYLTPLFPRTPRREASIHPSAVVAESATLGKGCHVGPLCYVGAGVVLGKGCILESQATVEEHAALGDDCLLRAGARVADHVRIGHRVILNQNCVVGSDGFSFVTREANAAEDAKAGRHQTTAGTVQGMLRIDSLGTVVLEDDVEVGASTTVDRATLGATLIRRGTKLDNQVQIGHNNEIGTDGLFCAHVGIAGSGKIGDRAVFAGQSGMGDHLTVGDDAVIMGRGGVVTNLEGGAVYAGMPAEPATAALRGYANIRKISDLRREIKKIRKQLDANAENS